MFARVVSVSVFEYFLTGLYLESLLLLLLLLIAVVVTVRILVCIAVPRCCASVLTGKRLNLIFQKLNVCAGVD